MNAIFKLPYPLVLEAEGVLDDVSVAWRSWGKLDDAGTNAVLICHALTGNTRALDPDRDFIVCSNILGSCYGTTGPGDGYGEAFPQITIRDMVALQRALIRHLGIHRLRLVIGGSLGGMQVLEWALAAPDLVEAIAPIAVSGRHSPWAIAISEAQRQAIYLDRVKGLAVARMIAMSMYRSHTGYQSRFGRERTNDTFTVETWLREHGDKLVNRFNAESYLRLTEAMDSHDVSRGRGNYEEVLASICQPALIPNATLQTIHSPHGHDAFLIEGHALNDLVLDFRRSLRRTVEDRHAAPPSATECSPLA